jgi:hypothetical protein
MGHDLRDAIPCLPARQTHISSPGKPS